MNDIYPINHDPEEILNIPDNPSDESKPKRQSIWTLLLISFWNIGVQFGYSAVFAYGTVLLENIIFSIVGFEILIRFYYYYLQKTACFLKTEAQPHNVIPSLARWTFDRIIFGIWSDRCTSKWGRRRPFIFAGLIITLIGMGLFANSTNYIDLFHEDHQKYPYFAIALSLVSLWILFIGVNIIQTTGWALVLDQNPEQQSEANALLNVLASISGMATFGLGFLNLTEIFPFFNSNGQGLFYIGIVTVSVSVIPTLFFKEKPLPTPLHSLQTPLLSENVSENNEDEHKEDSSNFGQEQPRSGGIVLALRETWTSLKELDVTVRWTLLLNFFVNMAYTPFQFYFTDYVGEDVYGGDADAAKHSRALDLYNTGVRYGSLALMVNLTIATLYSLILPRSQRILGIKFNLFVPLLLSFVAFLPPLILGNVPVAEELPLSNRVVITFLWSGSLAPLNAMQAIVPWAIVGALSENQSGLVIACMNSVQTVAQMVGSQGSSPLMQEIGVGTGIGAFGALSSLVAMIFIPKIKTPEKYFDELD